MSFDPNTSKSGKKASMTTAQLNEGKKLRARAYNLIEKGQLDEYVGLIVEMKDKGLIRKKAYDSYIQVYQDRIDLENTEESKVETDFKLKQMLIKMKEVEKESKRILNEGIDKEVDRRVTEIEKPIKLKVVEKLSQDSTSEIVKKRKQENARIRVATEKMFKDERQASLKLRELSHLEQSVKDLEQKQKILTRGTDKITTATSSKQTDLQDHFTNYDQHKESKIDFNKVHSLDFNANMRDALSRTKAYNATYNEMKFVFDNFVTSDEQIDIMERQNYELFAEIIESANLTSNFVPTYFEHNENLTTEERQKLYHQQLIEARMKNLQKIKARPTNFDNYNKMNSGINNGLEVKTTKDEETRLYETPDVFQDYEFLLDNKITDNAISRELYKGIDPNTLIDAGADPSDVAEYFLKMNEESAEQDGKEIREAVDNIEILSGGNRDTLFGTTDLLTTRNTRMRFNQDLPDDIDNAPAPLERGRDAQALTDVDLAEIDLQDRADNVTTIAHSFGILHNAFRSTYGINDVVDSRKNDILTDMNQGIRLAGKRGIYGDDMSLKSNDEMYEGYSVQARLNSLRQGNNNRIFSNKNPELLQKQEESQPTTDSSVMESMMFNKQRGGAMGASLQQLRQDEFQYKPASRSVAHNGYNFIRGGRSTQIKIEQEYDP